MVRIQILQFLRVVSYSNEIPLPLWKIHTATNGMKTVRFLTNVSKTKPKVYGI